MRPVILRERGSAGRALDSQQSFGRVRSIMQHAIRRWSAALVVLSAILLLPSTSSAQAADRSLSKPREAKAREHLVHGNSLYAVREFEKAVSEYKAGALAEAAPVFDYNLGQCYRLLGRYSDAIWHYDRFIRAGKPGEKLLGHVTNFIAQMKAELDKKAMTQPPVEAAADGTAPSSKTGPQLPSRILVRSDELERDEPWYTDSFGWGLAGSGVVALGASGLLFLSAAGLQDEANSEASQQRQDELRDKASTRRLLGTVIGIGSVSLLATGIIKLAIPSDRSRTRTNVASWELGISSSGPVAFGRF
ncbi:MAG: hypothetical protein WKG01_11360 [Kofleriaceae bacterium]